MANASPHRFLPRAGLAVLVPFWLLLLVVFGCTAMLQIDRQTRISPQLSPLVAGPFQSHALEFVVAEATRQKRDDAFNKAVTLIERRPLPADTLYLASLAAVGAGHNDVADATMALAASRGWRATLPNLLALKGSVEAQDWEGSVYRLAALHRMNATTGVTKQALAYVAESAGGRQAIADYAAGDPKFAFFVLRSAIETVPLPAAIDVIERTRAKGASFACTDLGNVANALLRRGKAAEARGLWPERCQKIAPDNFALIASPTGGTENDPFAWRWRTAPGLSRSFSGGEVRIRNSDPLERVFAERLLALQPGRYVIKWKSANSAQSGMERAADIKLSVACYPRSGRAGVEFMGTEYVLTVDEQCPVQRIELRTSRGQAAITGFTISG